MGIINIPAKCFGAMSNLKTNSIAFFQGFATNSLIRQLNLNLVHESTCSVYFCLYHFYFFFDRIISRNCKSTTLIKCMHSNFIIFGNSFNALLSSFILGYFWSSDLSFSVFSIQLLCIQLVYYYLLYETD